MERSERQVRAAQSRFETREEGGEQYIEGYFAVFGSNYELWPGGTESIAPGAFANTLGNDVRALIDHETRLVLGRNKAGTLELREDAHGLWGKIRINPNDTDALNLYNRVQRGDVDQCSFGFRIVRENTEIHEDGSVHWTIEEVELYEVSVVTFPAYEDTAVTARKRDFAEIESRRGASWRAEMTAKLKGEGNGT